MDPARGAVGFAAVGQLRRIDQAADAVEVLLVDNFSVVRVGAPVRAVLPENLLPQQGDQLILHPCIAENVVRGDAGLAAVQELAEGNAPGRQLQIRACVHDAGALSAQLQRHRRELRRGLFQHKFSHVGASGEEDEVELLLQQAGVFAAPSGDHRHVLPWKGFAKQRRDQRAGVGRIGAGLDHRRVARRDGVHQRIQRQQQRIVPGAHNQRHAVGRGADIASGGKLRKRRGHAFLPAERANVPQHVADLAAHQSALAHIALKRGLAQVGAQGFRDARFILAYRILKALQRVNAELNGQRRTAGKVAALRLHDGRNLLRPHASSSITS